MIAREWGLYAKESSTVVLITMKSIGVSIRRDVRLLLGVFSVVVCGHSAGVALPAHAADTPPHEVPAEPRRTTVAGTVHAGVEELTFGSAEWSVQGADFSWKDARTGDFDGDGRSDLLLIGSGGELSVLASRDGNRLVEWASGLLPEEVKASALRGNKTAVVDLDGDGHGELVIVRDGASDHWIRLVVFPGYFVVRDEVFLGQPLDLERVVSVSQSKRPASSTQLAVMNARLDMHFIAGNLSPSAVSGTGLFPIAPHSKIFSLQDLSGALIDEPVFYRPPNLFYRDPCRAGSCPANVERLVWAEFPKSAKFQAVAGDFDGDGRGDILAFVSNVLGWWVARSNGATGLEQPLRKIAPLRPESLLVAGDVDADGKDEALAVQTRERRVMVLSATNPRLAGIEILVDGKKEAVSGADGSFRISLTADAPHRIELSGEGRIFPRSPLRLTSGAERSTLSFAGYTPRKDFHQPFTFAGRETGPYVCNAYRPNANISKWSESTGACPASFGMYSSNTIKNDRNLLGAVGGCCRLPSDDVLASDRILPAKSICPEGAIAIGMESATPATPLLCGAISDRYELGPVVPGVYWGRGYRSLPAGKRVSRNDLPEAIRFGVGRIGFSSWTIEGCIGTPRGALLVSASSNDCSKTFFRELRYRGQPGDPPAHTPVKMFPSCSTQPDPFNPAAGCEEGEG